MFLYVRLEVCSAWFRCISARLRRTTSTTHWAVAKPAALLVPVAAAWTQPAPPVLQAPALRPVVQDWQPALPAPAVELASAVRSAFRTSLLSF